MSAQRLRLRFAFVVLAVVVMLLAGVASAYAAPLNGTLSGTVTGSSAPLEGVDVYVYTPAGSWAGSAVTTASGGWTLSLTPGDYVVFFETWTYNLSHPMASYVRQYYGDGLNWNAATPLTVNSEADTVANVNLAPGSYISGTVTGSAAPLNGVTVEARDGQYVDMSVTTDINGDYIISGLPPSEYTITFNPTWYNTDQGTDYCLEYWNNVHGWFDATLIPVDTGVNPTGIDADLEIGGSISGTVTGDSTPLDNVWVNVYDSGGSWIKNTLTSAEGTYTIDSLVPGDYRVQFDAGWYNSDHSTMFLTEYYDGARYLDTATPVTVSSDTDTPGIDATMEEGGGISGTVTGDGGPLDGLWVMLYQNGNMVGSTSTGVDGSYSFLALTPGDYQVLFYAWTYNSDNATSFLSEYYDNAPDADQATPVTASAGVLTTGIDANLEIGGSISGTVTGDGGPLENVWVWADTEAGDWGSGTYTDADGNYSITGLRPADYTVEFDPGWHNDSWATSFLHQYYDGVDRYADATPVSVNYATDTSGIDADLVIGGSISGTVTGDGGPLKDVDVYAYDYATDYWANAATDADGNYTVRGLPAGDYEIEFDPGWHNELYDHGFLSEYYDNVRDPADATYVSAALAEDTPGIDADLEIGATISGVVTGDAGATLDGVDVTIFDAAGNYYSDTWTSAGDWSIRGVPPGDYVLLFNAGDYNRDHSTSYVREFWNDKASFATANRITLAYNDVVTGLDAQLAQGGGSISGTVYEPDGTTVLPEVEVSAYELTPAGDEIWTGFTYSKPDGTYAIPGLATGSYYVEFWDTNYVYKTMLYDGVPGADEDLAPYFTLGTPVDVTTGQTTGGIDAVMQVPATLNASVVDAGGTGIEDIAVTLWYNGGAAGWVPVHTHYTDFDGTVVFDDFNCGLFPGEYKVQFVDETGDLGEAWYLDSATADNATTFTVAEGGTYTLDPQVMPFVAPTGVTFTPIQGDDRIDTAIAVSKKAFPDGASTVIVATGYNWPDALGGSALAGVLDAPLLLTKTDALPAEVATEIDRLGATKAIILGKTGAVDAQVETALKGLLGDANVERIGGEDRYETSLLVAARCVEEQGAGYDGTAFLATGLNFPDQIAAAPLAAGKGWPIYLTNPLRPGDAALLAGMRADGVTDAIVLGGTSAVSAASMQAVTSGVPCTGTRLGGVDRYDTARLIASYGVSDAGLSWDGIAITTGKVFPDGLVGGVLQGKSGSVLMLTAPDSLYSGLATVLTDNKDSIHEVRFLGGTSAVSTAVRTAVTQILQ